MPFKELSDQFIQMTEKEAEANGPCQKGVSRQRANVTLLCEAENKPVLSLLVVWG